MMDLFNQCLPCKLPSAREVLIAEFKKSVWIVWPVVGTRCQYFEVCAMFPDEEKYNRLELPRKALEVVLTSGEIARLHVKSMTSFNKYARSAMNIVDAYGEDQLLRPLAA